jgi:hypothetical protein
LVCEDQNPTHWASRLLQMNDGTNEAGVTKGKLNAEVLPILWTENRAFCEMVPKVDEIVMMLLVP